MSRMLVLAAVPEPVGEAPARLLDLLLRRLGDPLEAARVVVDGVARGGTRVDVVAALGVVAADDPVVLARAHPLRELVDTPHREVVGQAELDEEARESPSQSPTLRTRPPARERRRGSACG